MKPEEAKKLKEKRIQLFSRLKLRNIFPGEWESVYKGEGFEFADIRPFEPGDNPRDMDFFTLARSGEELVIERVEDRQLRVYVWADYSSSMQYFEEMLFPHKPLIKDIAVGMILFSAVKIYSPIGFYPFGLAKKKFFPSRMGERYCREILNWLSNPENLLPFISSGVEPAIKDLIQFAQPRSLVFFISDFKQKLFERDFSHLLKPVISRFDFIPVVVKDPLETSGVLPRSVRIKVKGSSAHGKATEIYLTPSLLQDIQRVSRDHLLNLENNFRALGLGYLVLDSPSIEDCHRSLSGFFQTRKQTKK